MVQRSTDSISHVVQPALQECPIPRSDRIHADQCPAPLYYRRPSFG